VRFADCVQSIINGQDVFHEPIYGQDAVKCKQVAYDCHQQAGKQVHVMT